MGTSGDKIVLLDGMGSGSGSAANGLLSMIPGMFTSLLGGNKMDPNLVAALMNGRNNQDQFGGANGWWLWIIVLFWYVVRNRINKPRRILYDDSFCQDKQQIYDLGYIHLISWQTLEIHIFLYNLGFGDLS